MICCEGCYVWTLSEMVGSRTNSPVECVESMTEIWMKIGVEQKVIEDGMIEGKWCEWSWK